MAAPEASPGGAAAGAARPPGADTDMKHRDTPPHGGMGGGSGARVVPMGLLSSDGDADTTTGATASHAPAAAGTGGNHHATEVVRIVREGMSHTLPLSYRHPDPFTGHWSTRSVALLVVACVLPLALLLADAVAWIGVFAVKEDGSFNLWHATPMLIASVVHVSTVTQFVVWAKTYRVRMGCALHAVIGVDDDKLTAALGSVRPTHSDVSPRRRAAAAQGAKLLRSVTAGPRPTVDDNDDAEEGLGHVAMCLPDLKAIDRIATADHVATLRQGVRSASDVSVGAMLLSGLIMAFLSYFLLLKPGMTAALTHWGAPELVEPLTITAVVCACFLNVASGINIGSAGLLMALGSAPARTFGRTITSVVSPVLASDDDGVVLAPEQLAVVYTKYAQVRRASKALGVAYGGILVVQVVSAVSRSCR